MKHEDSTKKTRTTRKKNKKIVFVPFVGQITQTAKRYCSRMSVMSSKVLVASSKKSHPAGDHSLAFGTMDSIIDPSNIPMRKGHENSECQRFKKQSQRSVAYGA